MISVPLQLIHKLISHKNTRKQAKETLFKLIEANIGYYPQHHSLGFSNHISMSLFAIYSMGASSQILVDHFEQITKSQEKRKGTHYSEPQSLITEQNLEQYANDTGQKNYDEFLSFYWNMKMKKGLNETIDYAFDHFGENISNHLFHIIIRLQFALQNDCEPDVIASLAYLSVKHIPFHLENTEQIGIIQLFEKFQKNKKYLEPLNDKKEEEIINSPEFKQIFQSVNMKESEFPILAKNLLFLFLRTIHTKQDSKRINFFVLHFMTGFLSFKYIITHYSGRNKQKIIDNFFRGLTSLYCVQKLPEFTLTLQDGEQWSDEQWKGKDLKKQQQRDLEKEFQSLQVLQWEEILQKCVQSNDVHTTKFGFCCWSEAKQYPQLDRLYRIAIQKRLEQNP